MTFIQYLSRANIHLRNLFLIIAYFMSMSVMAADAKPQEILEQGKNLLRQGDAAAAFELLIKSESELSGNDSFDYLLGVAALESGNPGEAIFSLQRLVARKPEFSGARLELARAYFETGDNELARSEFMRLLEEDPPDKVATMVADYLEVIKKKARSYQSSSQYYFDVGAGYDSNPAAATADDHGTFDCIRWRSAEPRVVFLGGKRQRE